ncbi:acyclic terpene utilization AtuA family protein [Yoonia sp. 208BN28-4]|uniref:acyclic terpene utilization AtuA family protein n=1 Tax=Yoonia sp. 208BN28-4 TaxID=3126505 RepID=UPI00309F9F5D
MTKVLIPSGALGLGYDATALARGVALKPDLIAVDGGSTDSGPSYLGRGVSKYARASTKAEWAGLIHARATAGCPLVIGTAGTCGTDSTVDWLVDITREILSEAGLTAKIATLKSEQDPADIAQTDLTPLSGAPEIDANTITDCTHIVALAGAEQIAAAINTGSDIIIAGRTTDTAIIAALPIMHGHDAGPAWHGAKIGECGALCATNPQSGVIMVDFDGDGFIVTPLADGAHATPHTVSAHMLYENSDPFILYEPGGHLDVTNATYTALDDTSVRVTGSKWVPSDTYTVKLEGARIAGHQAMVMATIRDAHYVANVQAWCDDITVKHRAKVTDRLGNTDFTLDLRIIGQNATLGPLENRTTDLTEVGVMGIVTAPTPEAAHDIARLLNPYLLHHPLTQEEEQPTFAFPFSPAEVPLGPLYSFALHHTMTLTDPMDAFRLEVLS